MHDKVSEPSDGLGPQEKLNSIIREVIQVERKYYFEKRHGSTARQRDLALIIDRHASEDGP